MWQARGRPVVFLLIIPRADMPCSAVWRGSRRPMDTNRCHRAGGCALEARGMAIAVPGELQESVGPGSEGRTWQFCVSSAIFLQNIALVNMPWSAVWRGSRRSMDTNRCHRASQCALEARRMAIAVTDELQENVGPGSNRALRAVCGSSVSGRGSSC